MTKDDSEKIIYTQIVPKNLRKADDGSDTETVKVLQLHNYSPLLFYPMNQLCEHLTLIST